jgi:hypothetical protein
MTLKWHPTIKVGNQTIIIGDKTFETGGMIPEVIQALFRYMELVNTPPSIWWEEEDWTETFTIAPSLESLNIAKKEFTFPSKDRELLEQMIDFWKSHFWIAVKKFRDT